MSDDDAYLDGSTSWDTTSYPTLDDEVSVEPVFTNRTNTGYGFSAGVQTQSSNEISRTPEQRSQATGFNDGQMLSGDRGIYNSFAGTDIVAQIIVPGEGPLTLGELETFSYSIHREKTPVRLLGRVNPQMFLSGQRTVAGTMIMLQFNTYVFYRLVQYSRGIEQGLYPLSDMLPPFDMVLTFANEYGVFAKMKIFGMNIIDEGGTMSIEDLVSEMTINWVAKGIQPLTGYYLTGGVS